MSNNSHPAQNLRNVQHFGEEGGVVPAIDHAATTTFLHPDDMEKVFTGELTGCYLYSRHKNPTVNAFGEKIAAMEEMEAGFGTASGMSAIYSTLSQILLDGGHIISSNTIYGGTYALFANIFTKRGIDISFVDPSDVNQFKQAIRKDTKVIYVESMSNPLLRIADIRRLADLAHENGIKLVVDNTFTPLIITPKALGADIVVYSCTKYISGSSDLIAGAICASRDFIDQLIDVNTGMCMLAGPVMDPQVAYKLYERLDHLPIRMKAHSEAALSLATFLTQKGVEGVIYPGLETHPEKQLYDQLRNCSYGHGGMITLDCGSLDRATKLASLLQEHKFGLFAVSLGFTRTLMSCPAASTSSEIPEEDRKKTGLKEGLLRLSIGCTGDSDHLNEIFWKCYKQL